MIRIQNIFHMLVYAFSVLNEQGYRDVAVEEFENTGDLYAAILERGIESQVKHGLGREYRSRTQALSSLRGKVNMSESLKSQAILRRQLVCSYDEFTVDSQMNRILKATVQVLLRSEISKTRKKKLKSLMVYFAEVKPVDLRLVDWQFRYDRNNRTYRMLMAICWLISKGLLQTQDDGSTRLMDFLDDQSMFRLYEKFLLEYYRKEHPQITATASYINWALDDGVDDDLPIMKSDIMLSRGDDVLIIDAKYYTRTMQQQFGNRTLHSGNLYQIFTYVKNKEAELSRDGAEGTVSGMLLYAKTDEDVQPDSVFQMSGNRISVQTLDLNLPFAEIRNQLDAIVDTHFGSTGLWSETIAGRKGKGL